MLPISLKKQSRGTNSAAIALPTRIIGFNLCETPPGSTAGSGFHLHFASGQSFGRLLRGFFWGVLSPRLQRPQLLKCSSKNGIVVYQMA